MTRVQKILRKKTKMMKMPTKIILLRITQCKKRKEKLLKIFKEQLCEKKFMNKLMEVGEYDFNSMSTYKELIKIFINLNLNRYYSKNFSQLQKILIKL